VYHVGSHLACLLPCFTTLPSRKFKRQGRNREKCLSGMSAKFQSADFCALRTETAGMLGTQPDVREKISEKINIKNDKNIKRENKNLSINHTATSIKYRDEFHKTVTEYKTAKWRGPNHWQYYFILERLENLATTCQPSATQPAQPDSTTRK
jgi:hypothetical protein